MANTASRAEFKKASAAFRQHLPDLTSPRFTTAKEQDAYEYVKTFRETKNPPWLYDLTQAWEKLYQEPFKGVTSDGAVIPNLFPIQDEGISTGSIIAAVQKLLASLAPSETEKLSFPLHAREWRAWSNPEFLLRPFGLRLDELAPSKVSLILAIVEATFSPEGYQKALAAMRINHFLGKLCHLPQILNQFSYNFLLFGTPSDSETQPWGWALYGHHLCLSVLFRGKQIVISPTFTGAEPNIIDDGEFEGTSILYREGDLGLQLMQSLDYRQQQKAQIFEALRDPIGMKLTGDLVTDRWNRDDQRHLCGAFRDNRIVPYEGINVSSELSSSQQNVLMEIIHEFLLYLPGQARKFRMDLIRSHFQDTWFCWIGRFGDEDAFYYRIQSPVIVVEFDHHSGVFLANEEPAKFHTHTLVRTPNGGDYGYAIRGEGENGLKL